jgi:hypothetical protein
MMMISTNHESVEITNKMQPCNTRRIYYSNVYWRLNIFRAPYRSSSEALNCICSLWFRYTCCDQRLQIQLELLMMCGVPLETCWAFNKLWNNKFYYKVASCWLFLLIHTTMHGSMKIKLLIMTSHYAVFSGRLVLPSTLIQKLSSTPERLPSLLWINPSFKICSYVTYVVCDIFIIFIFLSYLRLCLLKSAQWQAPAWMTACSIQAGALNSFPLPMCSE